MAEGALDIDILLDKAQYRPCQSPTTSSTPPPSPASCLVNTTEWEDLIAGGLVAICYITELEVGSDAGLGDRFDHAAWRAGVVMTVSYSTGVSRPSEA